MHIFFIVEKTERLRPGQLLCDTVLSAKCLNDHSNQPNMLM